MNVVGRGGVGVLRSKGNWALLSIVSICTSSPASDDADGSETETVNDVVDGVETGPTHALPPTCTRTHILVLDQGPYHSLHRFINELFSWAKSTRPAHEQVQVLCGSSPLTPNLTLALKRQ